MLDIADKNDEYPRMFLIMF